MKCDECGCQLDTRCGHFDCGRHQSYLSATVVVISDIHSRQFKLMQLLQEIGAMDDDGVRQWGYRFVQVGDAVSAGYGMEEADFYRWWTSILKPGDVELVGNHEAPILWPYDNRLDFYGYQPGDMGTAGCDPKLKLEVIRRAREYRVAHVEHGWLITHAGVSSRFLREDAVETADYLNRLWRRHLGPFEPHPFMGCPICDPDRGVLWVRDLEKTGKQPRRIKQVFGHTPDGPTLGGSGTIWNIDTPRVKPFDYEGGVNVSRAVAEDWGGVSALVRGPGDEDWTLHYVE
jgi:hypothetical protein